jgi:hypothetical protein
MIFYIIIQKNLTKHSGNDANTIIGAPGLPHHLLASLLP